MNTESKQQIERKELKQWEEEQYKQNQVGETKLEGKEDKKQEERNMRSEINMRVCMGEPESCEKAVWHMLQIK